MNQIKGTKTWTTKGKSTSNKKYATKNVGEGKITYRPINKKRKINKKKAQLK